MLCNENPLTNIQFANQYIIIVKMCRNNLSPKKCDDNFFFICMYIYKIFMKVSYDTYLKYLIIFDNLILHDNK